jgi:hypothetical protein
MKLAKPIFLSMAINCLAFITLLFVGAQSLNAQAFATLKYEEGTNP